MSGTRSASSACSHAATFSYATAPSARGAVGRSRKRAARAGNASRNSRGSPATNSGVGRAAGKSAALPRPATNSPPFTGRAAAPAWRSVSATEPLSTNSENATASTLTTQTPASALKLARCIMTSPAAGLSGNGVSFIQPCSRWSLGAVPRPDASRGAIIRRVLSPRPTRKPSANSICANEAAAVSTMSASRSNAPSASSNWPSGRSKVARPSRMPTSACAVAAAWGKASTIRTDAARHSARRNVCRDERSSERCNERSNERRSTLQNAR